MSELADLLSYEFLRNAVLAGLVASLLCGVIGTFVVVKRLAFISGGISHAAFGGLGVCYYLGLEPTLGAAAVAILCAVFLGAIDTRRLQVHDALIGVLWAVGMAVGLVFLHWTPGYAPDLGAYLFGNILTVTSRDLAVILIFALVALVLLFLFFKDFVAVSFDETFAAVQGVPVRLLTVLLLVLVSLSVVMLIQVVGILLVLALLTIPPLIGLLLVRNLAGVIAISVATGTFVTLVGLGISYRWDVPPGPAIVLLGATLLGAVWAFRQLWQPRASTPEG